MKKIYTMIAALAVIVSATAQNKQLNDAPRKLVPNPKLQAVTDLSNFKASTSQDRVFSGWLNYALQLDDATNGFSPGLASASFMLVFPDSNIIMGQYTSGATAYPQFHKTGTWLDPKNMPFNGINATDAYSLDSVGIVYGYLRSLPSTVVDTLRIDIVKHSVALEWTMSSGGLETYQDIEYDQPTDKIKATNVLATYYYYLTQADSSSTAAELYVKTTLPTQAAGNRIGAIVTFKPGYSYTITDSINNKNAFYILSYEQNGASTDPTYYGVSGDATSDMNCSMSLPTDVRYGTNANGWNGYFIPTWAWTTPFAYEHHIIEFKISNPPTGINELASKGVKVEQNYPNPCNNSTAINYELANNSKVLLSVFDVTGKVVATQNVGEQNAGKHVINFNASNLSAGLYTYSLTVGQNTTSTMKMVVIK